MSEMLYRPGLEGVVAGETAISTTEDGLLYRGYAIEDLVQCGDFEETAYLLLYGELPNVQQLSDLRRRLVQNAQLSPEILAVLEQLPAKAPLMDVLRTGVSLLSHWDPDTADNSPEANLRKAERLLAQAPMMLAAFYRRTRGLPPVLPSDDLSFAGRVFELLRGERPTPLHEQAMNASMVIYAEDEFTASTFTARVVCSTLSDLHSAVTAAIGALKGTWHGGANERVMEVLHEVGDPGHAEAWVRAALSQKRRIMGFGHRIYKDCDPRAELLKPICRELARVNRQDALEQTADVIERIVRQEKELPANVDWPSARLYYYLGLPIELYTPLFVLSRITGWSAHAMEQLAHNRLIRPRGRYTGPTRRTWRPLTERGR